MKYRVISMVLILVLALGLMAPSARAAEPEGQWIYEQMVGGLRLTGYLGDQRVLTLPDTLAGQAVISVGAKCFQGSRLTEVTVPHGIRVIEEEAFAGCKSLKKVHLGGSVNVIGDRAFANTGLIEMDIPGCVRSIGAEAFLGCTSLRNVVIEEGVEDWSLDIGEGFGSGSVKMEEGMESIGDRAFYGCTNLTKMFVPASVTRVGNQAMGYTDAGKQDYQITGYAGSAAERYANANGLTFKTLSQKDEYTGVCGAEAQWSFDRDSGILTVTGQGRMYDYVAAECLPWYAFREQITAAVVEDGVTSVGDFAFSHSAVAQVTLPDSLKWVGSRAFADCAELTELTFPGDAPVFAGDAFEHTTLTAWYTNAGKNWTLEVRQNYGGSVTWKNKDGLPFVDVPVGSFFYDPVAWAVERGITTGIDNTHFGPGDNCQRAAVVTFLWRAAGSPKPESTNNPFVDVKPADFYYDAVLWAVEKGITNGLDTTHFGPFAYCNRAQVVTFLHRTMGSPAANGGENPFADVPEGAWYAASVLWAVENRITQGMSATSFGPEEICNRAQIVTFLYRTLAEQN